MYFHNSSVAILLLFLSFSVAISLQAQPRSTVKGIILVQDGRDEAGNKVYVADAVVEDELRQAEAAVVTDQGGRFTLSFDLPRNKTVYLKVKKSGMVLVDKEIKAVTGQEDWIRIYMVPKKDSTIVHTDTMSKTIQAPIDIKWVGIGLLVLSTIIGLLIKSPSPFQKKLFNILLGTGIAMTFLSSAETSKLTYSIGNLSFQLGGAVVIVVIFWILDPLSKIKDNFRLRKGESR